MASSVSFPAAIFSPSVARQAASVARDWNYVDSWLSFRLGHRVATFERNPDTLRLLHALASCNESADEERTAMAEKAMSMTSKMTNRVRPKHADSSTENWIGFGERRGAFNSIPTRLTTLWGPLESHIAGEGWVSLDALAVIASMIDVLVDHDTCQSMSQSVVSLKGSFSENRKWLARTCTCRAYLDTELSLINLQLGEIYSNMYRASAHLANANPNLQRSIKAMLSRLAELDERWSNMEGSYPGIPSAAALTHRQQTYLERMLYKDHLNYTLSPFNGLPSDHEVAQAHMDARRHELHILAEHREIVFEALVVQESPLIKRYA
jgi:HAUS augmin-like complex subunit 1